MAQKDEDLMLVSLLTAHPADCIPYFRLPYFLDMFPARRAAAEWVTKFWDQNSQLPKLGLLKKHFPACNTLQSPEPLPYCYGILKQFYIDTIAANAGEKMTDAIDKKDMAEFLKHNTKLTELISQAERPLSAMSDDIDGFVEQMGLSLDKNSSLALKVMSTGFKPLDDEDGGGFRPGHIYVLASLVNLGKTYVSLAIAENLRKAGFRVVYTSTEMPKEDLSLRAIAVRFNLDVDQLIKKEQPKSSIEANESKEDWYKRLLQDVQSKIDADTTTGKLFIRGNDAGFITPRQILSDVKELSADVVIIDAAQDLRDDKLTKDRTPALYNAISELNSLMISTGVALFVTVQLDSEVEKKGLTQGNLNRIAWAQVFAQKAHVAFTMLGSRDSDFRDMCIEKSRDGKAGRKFWLTFKFPCVNITASTKTPGTLDDLSTAKPASTVSELESALNGMTAAPPPAHAPPPPTVSSPPTKRVMPVRAEKKAEQQTPPPASDDERKSPYENRREAKTLKKLKAFHGKRA